MDDDSHRRHDGPRHRGEDKTSPYPLSRLAPTYDLVDVAREIQKADAMLGAVTQGQLEVIASQIRALQSKARALLEQTERSARLHRVRCGFKKRVGHVYHLYERPSGDLYFSMLAPSEWGGAPPHRFAGSFRLEPDLSLVDVTLDDPSRAPVDLSSLDLRPEDDGSDP